MKNTLIAGALLASVFAGDSSADVGEYTYGCWPNGWRKNANDRSADIFAIETSHYGFSLDVADLQKIHLGLLNFQEGYEQALENDAAKLSALPAAKLSIELEVDGVLYRANTCKAGLDKGVKRLSSVRLWESGRYVQHYEFLGLDFRTPEGQALACEASLDLVAWPQSLTFTLNLSTDLECRESVLRLGLESQAGTWGEGEQVLGPWKSGQDKSVSLTLPLGPRSKALRAEIAVSTAGGQAIPVRFDPEKNCMVAPVTRLQRSWKAGYTDIRDYDEFKIVIQGTGDQAAVPFLLDMRPPANVTGVCPILCDETGRPTGIPVQLSKNWHHAGMGSYLMAYTMLPAGKQTATYVLRLAYGFYGTLPSASHAQLSLVGYGEKSANNGRWDQLAIGCWGETICFDMDMSCVDVSITDIRMLMARDGRNGRKWGWTNAGWGGDWLSMRDERQKKYFQNRLKTAYLSHGPCLTDVKHQGYYGANQEVAVSARIHTLRTDDYARTFQNFTYTFTRDTPAADIRLFKLGRTFNYQTPRLAYGNGEGLLKEDAVPATLKKNQLFLDRVELTGASPHWVAFQGGSETSNSRGKPNGYRALIVRRYKVVSGGKTYENPVISAPVHKSPPANLDLELLPPVGLSRFSKGDRIELDLELITLPRQADDYYGPNEFFRKHLTEHPDSWKTTHREAKGNDLEVRVMGGQVLHNYPLLIQVEEPEVTVEIAGGVGAVPIRFEGLKSGVGNRLYQVVDGKRIPLDQSVHGSDYWQTDYDAATQTYKVSYNLPLDGLDRSRWIMTQE